MREVRKTATIPLVFMTYANVVYSGGEAKVLIQEGQVQVNGEACTMRGRKLRPGDTFTFDGSVYAITEKP